MIRHRKHHRRTNEERCSNDSNIRIIEVLDGYHICLFHRPLPSSLTSVFRIFASTRMKIRLGLIYRYKNAAAGGPATGRSVDRARHCVGKLSRRRVKGVTVLRAIKRRKEDQFPDRPWVKLSNLSCASPPLATASSASYVLLRCSCRPPSPRSSTLSQTLDRNTHASWFVEWPARPFIFIRRDCFSSPLSGLPSATTKARHTRAPFTLRGVCLSRTR